MRFGGCSIAWISKRFRAILDSIVSRKAWRDVWRAVISKQFGASRTTATAAGDLNCFDFKAISSSWKHCFWWFGTKLLQNAMISKRFSYLPELKSACKDSFDFKAISSNSDDMRNQLLDSVPDCLAVCHLLSSWALCQAIGRIRQRNWSTCACRSKHFAVLRLLERLEIANCLTFSYVSKQF